jgi:hypothetical protein
MTTKLIATTAVAALALPAAALAERPADKPAKPDHPAKQAKKPKKAKSVGFSVGGVDLSGLTVTDGKLAGPLTLDPTSANKHARTFLQLSKTDLKGEKTVSLGTAADAVRVRYEGLTATDTIQPTDRVKVIGKVSGSTLDIRKIVVKRESTTTTS